MEITVPAGITPLWFFQIMKFSLPLALFAKLAEPLDKNALSVNLINVPSVMSTHVAKTKVSGAFNWKPMIDKSPAANTVAAAVILAVKPVGCVKV